MLYYIILHYILYKWYINDAYIFMQHVIAIKHFRIIVMAQSI